MSAYATLVDFRSTIKQDAFVSVPDAVITTAIAQASAYADGYLQAQFALPLSVWAEDLTRAVCQVAAYYVMRYRGFRPQGNDQAWADDAYKEGKGWLEDVARGHINPMITDATPGYPDGFTAVSSGQCMAPWIGYDVSRRAGPYSRGW